MNKNAFIRKDFIVDEIKKFIKSENSCRNFLEKIELFQPEYVTECERRTLYRVNGENSSCLSSSDVTTTNDIKQKWVLRLSRISQFKLVDMNVSVSDINYNISGKVDAIFKVDFEAFKSVMRAILITHPVDGDIFENVKKNGPMRKHIVEDMAYMWLSDVENEIMVYENISNSEFEIFHAVTYTPIVKAIKQKYWKLLNYKISGVIPPRSYENKNSNECKVCEFQRTCWKNEGD